MNYRKQCTPWGQPLLPEAEFRLYAICSRFPQNLAAAGIWRPLQDGVYECHRGTDVIRVVVANDLPRTDNNAVLHLLSAAPDQIRFGATHYQRRSAVTSTLIDEILKGYQQEGLDMPYTLEDFRRDYVKKHLKDLTLEERLEGLSPAERVQGLSPDEIEELLQRSKQAATKLKPKKKK